MSNTAGLQLISVVDDDESVRESLPDLLRELGFDVRAFSSAEEFLVSDYIDKTSCLILDIAMPGMTGLQLAEAARELRPGLPILLATGYADVPASTLIDLPRLSKPYHQKQLAEHITALMKAS